MAEHAVYVAASAREQGVGGLLLADLIASAEAAGVWTLQSGIFPENTISLELHGRPDFRIVGCRKS